jgi:hypothetical protein
VTAPEKVDLELARMETVSILRRMADLIEQNGEGRRLRTYKEIQRLRRRARELHVELRRRPET